jgi:2-polyprenyl-3-methyl-5-hydroxy-6-metoxy-1,4-benzoquinol methylase
MSQSKEILESWEANAEAWIATIDNNELESRRLVTNDAIIKTVLKYAPRKVLDMGCGEGWLSRSLRKKGVQVWGTDAVQTFVDTAIANDGGFYFRYSYEEIIAGTHRLPAPFDAVVINFALIDKEVTESLIAYLPRLMRKEGYLMIQTLHPLTIAATQEYYSGWKDGSWNGMNRNFVLPYQWYFRTLEDWTKLFIQSGFKIEELSEAVHPQTGKPLSVIFVLKLSKSS